MSRCFQYFRFLIAKLWQETFVTKVIHMRQQISGIFEVNKAVIKKNNNWQWVICLWPRFDTPHSSVATPTISLIETCMNILFRSCFWRKASLKNNFISALDYCRVAISKCESEKICVWKEKYLLKKREGNWHNYNFKTIIRSTTANVYLRDLLVRKL